MASIWGFTRNRVRSYWRAVSREVTRSNFLRRQLSLSCGAYQRVHRQKQEERLWAVTAVQVRNKDDTGHRPHEKQWHPGRI